MYLNSFFRGIQIFSFVKYTRFNGEQEFTFLNIFKNISINLRYGLTFYIEQYFNFIWPHHCTL
jgi:hypothetical protein